ncbi:MAG: hypothetical protein ACE5GB_09720, partial [Acidimicrobiales bacterium]
MSRNRVKNLRVGVAAAIIGSVSGLALVAGAVPAPAFITGPSAIEVSGPCDEAEHADDARCADVNAAATATTSIPTTSVPTTSVPTTSVPTTSIPTTSTVPTTSIPTTSTVPTTSIPT